MLDGQALESREEALFVLAEQEDGCARRPSAACTPDALHVDIACRGRSNLKDERDIGIVDAARRHVRGQQHLLRVLAEGVGGVRALGRRASRVDLQDGDPHLH